MLDFQSSAHLKEAAPPGGAGLPPLSVRERPGPVDIGSTQTLHPHTRCPSMDK